MTTRIQRPRTLKEIQKNVQQDTSFTYISLIIILINLFNYVNCCVLSTMLPPIKRKYNTIQILKEIYR